MKVFFLNPPAVQGVKMVREGRCMQRKGAWTAVWAPISLTTMAAVLERVGFKTEVLDAIVEGVSFKALEKVLAKSKPDLLVINTTTPSIESDLSAADLAKKIHPGIKTVAFGIHVSALPKESFSLSPRLDGVVCGEPEMTILKLSERLRGGQKVPGLDGLFWRKGKRIIQGKSRAPIKDLDWLPFPAWEKISVKKYRLPFSRKPFLLVNTGRGCSYSCRFCAAKTFYGGRVRLPSTKHVVDEMESNLKKFGVKDFLFWTESFTANRRFSKAICQEILKRKLVVNWVCNSRVDSVDLAQLKLFKKAGCWMIGFGVESGDDRILRLMNKKMTVSQIAKAVKMAKKAGLEVTGHMILGYPGETEETIKKTVDLAIDLDLDFGQFYTCVPFPGSSLYPWAKKKNCLTTTDWSRFEQNFAIMDLPGLPAKRAEALRAMAFRRFYLRPKPIFKSLLRLRSPLEFLNFFQMIKEFWSWS